jgi:CO dehydrogenase/acetyl-CoA synthase gamma subunit (corrinoid Fe-S protein)
MILADLYEESIRIESYVSSNDCRACGFHSRTEFLDRLRAGKVNPSQCKMEKIRFLSLLWAVRPDEILPEVEVLQFPSPGPTGLFPINRPEKDSPILVSGNSKLTVEVLTAVDMAMVYKVLTAERIVQILLREKADQFAPQSTLFLPGFAESISTDLAEQSGRAVTVGPVCAAELPLFFGEIDWKVA